MTTSAPRRRRRRPAAPHRTPAPTHTSAPSTPTVSVLPRGLAPATVPPRCCAVSTTEHRSLGGTIIRTHRHQRACPVWTAR
ncbi:hypothetical protein [Kitasatospora sp. NPDC059327]|uniref:hypothetical protein n=1 Tax=Kitasatospora sp. NPDC059327 TaxID=3346803 RepID=UPI0036815589